MKPQREKNRETEHSSLHHFIFRLGSFSYKGVFLLSLQSTHSDAIVISFDKKFQLFTVVKRQKRSV